RCLQENGFKVRFVILDRLAKTSVPAMERRSSGIADKRYPDSVEVEYVDKGKPLTVSANDVFAAANWWTAYVAHKAAERLEQRRFLYLISEYEPQVLERGTPGSLAEQSYALPHFAFFSSELLSGFFRSRGIGVFASGRSEDAQSSVSFNSAIVNI